MKKNVLFFDFDGVIAETLPMGFSINQGMMPDLEYGEWAGWFMGNIYKNIRKEHSNDKSQAHFHSQYCEQIDNCLMTKGMEEVIKNLSNKYELIIISSSVSDGIKRFLENNNMASHFKQILGADVHRSKVEKFNKMIKKYGISPSETLIVTDSVGDVLEAKKAGIGSLAVTWGVHDKKTLAECGPDFIANTPKEIIVGVDEILKKSS